MSDFTSVSGATAKDPSKRVRYSHGLVLGVDEFEQEQLYFLEQGRLHNRRLHGYGQVCGLHVGVDNGKVTVSKGLAISPKGALIRVPEDQCGDLADWLDANGGASAMPVYVKLCHLECDSDSVPVPGAPCRDETDSVAPSRTTESFSLSFSSTAPDQTEHLAVSRLGDLLALLHISETPGAGALALDDLPDLLQTVVDGVIGTDPIPVQASEIEGLLDALLRLWTSVYQPQLLADGASCAGDAPDEDCIVLAVIDQHNGGYRISLDQRPHLLSTRLLQELLLHMPGLASPDEISGPVGGDLRGTLPDPEVDGIVGFPIDDAIPPEEGQLLIYRKVIESSPPLPLSGNGSHWELNRLTVDDLVDVATMAPQQDQVLRYEQSSGQWHNAGLKIESLDNVANDAPSDGQALVYSGGLWQAGTISSAPTGAAGGDLTGTYPNPTVDGLQGRSVSGATPATGDLLTWNGSAWVPAGPAPIRTLPFAEISSTTSTELDREGFDVWFHVEVLPNDVEVRLADFGDSDPNSVVQIQVETGSTPFLDVISQVDGPRQRFRNLYFLSPDLEQLRRFARPGFLLLRFVFFLEKIPVDDPRGANTLKEWMDLAGIVFDGYDPDAGTVTRFLRVERDIARNVDGEGGRNPVRGDLPRPAPGSDRDLRGGNPR